MRGEIFQCIQIGPDFFFFIFFFSGCQTRSPGASAFSCTNRACVVQGVEEGWGERGGRRRSRRRRERKE
jgi:hypothetical protein